MPPQPPRRAPSATGCSAAFTNCPSCSLPLSTRALQGHPGDSQRAPPPPWGPLAHGSLSFCPESPSSPDTYYDKQDKIDEVVERVSIHHVVHDLHPAFQGDHLQAGQSRRGEREPETAEPPGRQAAQGKLPQTEAPPRAGTLYTRPLSYFSPGLHGAAILIPNMQGGKPRLRRLGRLPNVTQPGRNGPGT